MSELISGKEALIALANGAEVEYKTTDNAGSKWHQAKMLTVNTIMNFDDACILFRLKPRTITIHGIEVPAPFEPKEDEDCRCYYINTALKHGFDWYHPTHHESNRVAWRTEEEIRQVIAALRIAFKPQ